MDALRMTTDRSPHTPETLDPEHPLFGLGYAPPVVRRTFTRITEGTVAEDSATVAEEVPVALVYNGRPHVVMMCTPADIEDFAYGFTRTEAIVHDVAEIGTVRAVQYSQGIEVAISIPEERAEALTSRGRSLVGRTGCGLCGVTTIGEALRPGHALRTTARFAPEALFRAGEALASHQHYNHGTSAVHAAAWATTDGAIVLAREDVGRHNALDKLIGAMSRSGVDAGGGFAIVTSRASYELVQKCAASGIVALVAVSRPTGLAVRMAQAANIGLAGLVRGASANLYAHPEIFGV